MARTKNIPTAPVETPELDQQALAELQNTGAALVASHSEERDLVNQLLGQTQMAGAFEEFSRTVRTSKLAYVKENKLYKALAGKKSPNGSELKGTWEEFCNLLNISVDKADLDITNLRAFGEEALESMSRMGIGYRELRQFRKLPDDSRSALIEAAKLGNQEAVEYLAEELLARHDKEKGELTKALDDARADHEAQGEVLARKSRELDDTRMELEKARRRINTLTAEEADKELRKQAALVAYEAEVAVNANLREVCSTMLEHAERHGTDHRPFLASMVRHLESQLAAIRDEFALPDGVEEFAFLTAELELGQG
ncbi:hypothetical protein CK507_15805 [Pseudomonas sp. WN033]|nr:hypothetical protein CK507_15805 [Pseudomonas sp. WN033]